MTRSTRYSVAVGLTIALCCGALAGRAAAPMGIDGLIAAEQAATKALLALDILRPSYEALWRKQMIDTVLPLPAGVTDGISATEYAPAEAAITAQTANVKTAELALDAARAAQWAAVSALPATLDGNLVPALEVACVHVAGETRREVDASLRTRVPGLETAYTGDIIAGHTLLKYCLNAAHGKMAAAESYLRDWITATIYISQNQALHLDNALYVATNEVLATIDQLTLPAKRRTALRARLLQILLNPVLNTFDVLKNFGDESASWTWLQEQSALLEATFAVDGFLHQFGVHLYDPLQGAIQQRGFCAPDNAQLPLAQLGVQGAAKGAGATGMAMDAGGSRATSAMGATLGSATAGLLTPFGASLESAKANNCPKGGSGLMGSEACLGFGDFMGIVQDGGAMGMGTCSLFATAGQGRPCKDLCAGGGDASAGAVDGCMNVPFQLGWVKCTLDPFSNPIEPNPQPYARSGDPAGGAPGMDGMGGGGFLIESIVQVPTGSMCDAAGAETPDGSGKTETPVNMPKTGIEKKIDDNKQKGQGEFDKKADELRKQAEAQGTTISDEQHAKAKAAAKAAMENATPTNFKPASGKEQEDMNKKGQKYKISPDGKEVTHNYNAKPGGLFDPASGRIFVDPAAASGPSGAGVVAHEGGHAYLQAAGVGIKNHHAAMEGAGFLGAAHQCAPDTGCGHSCTASAGQYAPPGGCKGYPAGPKPTQPDCIVAECLGPKGGNGPFNTDSAGTGTKKGGPSSSNVGGGSSACVSGTTKSACWAVDCAPTTSPADSWVAASDSAGGTGKGNSGTGVGSCCNKGAGGNPYLGIDWSNAPGYGLIDPSPFMKAFTLPSESLSHTSTPQQRGPQATPQQGVPGKPQRGKKP